MCSKQKKEKKIVYYVRPFTCKTRDQPSEWKVCSIKEKSIYDRKRIKGKWEQNNILEQTSVETITINRNVVFTVLIILNKCIRC